MKIEVKQVPANEVLPVRQTVLRQGKPLAEAIFEHDGHPDTFHLAAIKEDTIIGVVSFIKTEHEEFAQNHQYQLRGMAVLPDFQNLSIGNKLLQKGEETLQHKHVTLLWCNARLKAVNFYKKNGFNTHGNEFNIPEVGPHYLMFKIL